MSGRTETSTKATGRTAGGTALALTSGRMAITIRDTGKMTGGMDKVQSLKLGIKKWVNGDLYSGEWKSDNREGEGQFVWSNGNKYIGQWKKNKKNGLGTYLRMNGDKYVG